MPVRQLSQVEINRPARDLSGTAVWATGAVTVRLLAGETAAGSPPEPRSVASAPAAAPQTASDNIASYRPTFTVPVDPAAGGPLVAINGPPGTAPGRKPTMPGPESTQMPKPSASQPPPAAAKPVDPFDPVIFNQQLHPGR